MQPRKKSNRALAVVSKPSLRTGPRLEWNLLTDEELRRPGATLINLILTAASDRGIGLTKIADEALGISSSYFSQLRSGERPVPGLGDEHIARAAKFLQMPAIAIMLAAGRVKVEDFYTSPSTFEERLVPALKHMQRDPEFGALIHPSIFKTDTAIQKCLVLLYEKAKGEVLISAGKVTTEELLERHQAMVAAQSAKSNS